MLARLHHSGRVRVVVEDGYLLLGTHNNGNIMRECFGTTSKQRLLRTGPLIVALATINISAATLQAAAPVLQRAGRPATAPHVDESRRQRCVHDKERALYGAGRLVPGRLAALATRGGGVESEEHEAEVCVV